MAGFGAERAAVDERALVVGDGVLDQHGVGQVPVDAGEIFKAEFVGAVGAVPRTRFLHLSLRLLARSLGSIFWLDLLARSYRHFSQRAEPWSPIYDTECLPARRQACDPISSLTASAKTEATSRLTG